MSKVVAGVLPAGSVPPVASLPSGINVFTIIKKEDGSPLSYFYVQFPDGFTKTFQVTGIEQLTAQISGLLRGRYGVEVVNYTKIPQVLDENETIEITIGD
jgi:hypothetical protein